MSFNMQKKKKNFFFQKNHHIPPPIRVNCKSFQEFIFSYFEVNLIMLLATN